MKMIRAIIRPEMIERVVDALDEAGITAFTKIDVIGRGKQKGIHQENIHYDELPKRMIILVTEDDAVDQTVEVITESAHTGNFGDGKIFVSPVEKAYTVRTRSEGI